MCGEVFGKSKKKMHAEDKFTPKRSTLILFLLNIVSDRSKAKVPKLGSKKILDKDLRGLF